MALSEFQYIHSSHQPPLLHSPMYAMYTRNIHICTGGTHMCTIGLYSPIYACYVHICVQYTYVYMMDPPVNMYIFLTQPSICNVHTQYKHM